jgi:hypothetical protein
MATLTVDGNVIAGMLVAGFGAETANLVDCAAAWAWPRLADADLTNGPSLRGKVALVDRGGVPAIEKARRIQATGALACAIVNTNDKAWRPGGHMPAGATEEDVGADITIPVIVVPRSAARIFGDGDARTVLSLQYSKADTPSMEAKKLFAKSAGRATQLRSALTGLLKSPTAERKLPGFGDE